MANDGQNIVKRIQYIAYMETYQRYLTGQCYLMGSLKPTLLDYLQSDLNDRLHFINQRSFHKSPSSTLANTVKVFNQNDLDKSRDNKDSRRIIIVQKPKSRPKIEPGTLTFNLWDQIAHIDLTGVFNLSSVGLRRGFKTSNMASTKEFNKKRIIKPEKRNIGMVFQDYALFPHMTVSKNIGYGITSRKDKNKRVEEVLKLVEMEDYAKRYPHELSGGQQQRIALARALAPEPSLLLMDEPFSSLDHDLQIKIREELRSIIKKAGITSVFVTHNRENCESISDEIIELENGKIKYSQSKTTSLN